MGCQVRYGTIAIGAYYAHQPGSHQFAFTDQYKFPWDRGNARALTLRKDPLRWSSKWSYGCKINFGTPSGTDGATCFGSNEITPDYFTPPAIMDGSQGLKYLKGQCIDTFDNPLSGVNVRGYETSNNTFAGYTVQSREDGSFDLPTNFPGVPHYVVAYITGSPDRGGTTLNTLTPTNIDGT
jgi:hypothetical protein